jgi:hypothetical protein
MCTLQEHVFIVMVIDEKYISQFFGENQTSFFRFKYFFPNHIVYVIMRKTW